ncbi:uncharacterized protein CMU_034420 [Cryptosporidium muris RN66]|uniref:LEM3/CDC50 family protein n=1 Tax=Cryptosporidium muris (strain RN66) TaxID=441375 RepID=B6AFR5_CRYMR|nr:uncharacterized protein CMU_034420 [Cryptosporidium muris RN66]EEA07056.1 hypothetical protein, conserved [Cryptosporidium muris RN66]|eukprot:XP_002141405.1 hypothetical protein [Cryptosporidium muris RN66]
MNNFIKKLSSKKEKDWKESERWHIFQEWRSSRGSVESIISSTPNDHISSSGDNRTNEKIRDLEDITENIQLSYGEPYSDSTKISFIDRALCDVSSVGFTTYASCRIYFIILSGFFFLLSILLGEESWSKSVYIKIPYDSINNKVPELKSKYKKDDKTNTVSKESPESLNNPYNEMRNNITFHIDQTLHDPIYIYYGLNQFYSNTKNFVSSKPSEVFGPGYKCTHLENISDILRYRPDLRVLFEEFFRVPKNFDFNIIDGYFSEKDLSNKIFGFQKINPKISNIFCGIAIYSLFTDEFDIFSRDYPNEKIPIQRYLGNLEEQWKLRLFQNFRYHVNNKLRNFYISNSVDIQNKMHDDKPPLLSLLLARWWTQHVSPNFIKIYGVISSSIGFDSCYDFILYPGNYGVDIYNVFPSNLWGSEKYLLLMNLSIFGGKQYLAAFLCLFISLSYCVLLYFDPKTVQKFILDTSIPEISPNINPLI